MLRLSWHLRFRTLPEWNIPSSGVDRPHDGWLRPLQGWETSACKWEENVIITINREPVNPMINLALDTNATNSTRAQTSRAAALHAAVSVKCVASCGILGSCCSLVHFGMLCRNSCFLSELTAAFCWRARGLLSPCLKSTAVRIYKRKPLIWRKREGWKGNVYRSSREEENVGETWSEKETHKLFYQKWTKWEQKKKGEIKTMRTWWWKMAEGNRCTSCVIVTHKYTHDD